MNWLRRLFGSNNPALVSASFVNPITTELHSHLLPGIDDGVQSLEESIDVLRYFASVGYRKVITTPHIMGDFYKNSPANILPLLETVREALREQQVDIELQAAAEYMIDDAFSAKIDAAPLLTFGDRCVLVEMPFSAPAPNLKDVLFALKLNGYQPVLAHPERYLYYGMNKQKYHELWDAEVLFQININSLSDYYSVDVNKAAAYLIKQKMVNMIGSDCHGMRTLPGFKTSIATKLYEDVCALPLMNNHL